MVAEINKYDDISLGEGTEMGVIVFLMGKSSTGKDTLFKRLQGRQDLSLSGIVPYTTRPIRNGEKDGMEYFFTDEAGYEAFRTGGKIIEARAYHTCHGLWRYFTVDDGQIDLSHGSYLMIGTLASYLQVQEYFNRDKILPVLIELDDGKRLQRALNREKKQPQPRYEEMCRRFLADAEDFSEDKIREAGIRHRFHNDELDCCEEEIIRYLLTNIGKI